MAAYQLSLSLKFVCVTFLFTCLACFFMGRLARQGIVYHHHQLQEQQQLVLLQQQEKLQQNTAANQQQGSLPPLFVAPHKTRPSTRYTAKHFDTGKSVGSDTLLSSNPNSSSNNKPQVEQQDEDNLILSSYNHTDDEEDDEIHEPAGQHLLIDIEHVDGAFLNSEYHLAQAMIDLVDKSGLTMLSYHCHKLLPAGVSCAGVLLESHVSFHTWPVQGVITLDLFTCGPNSLLNLLDDVKTLFAIAKDNTKDDEEQPPQPNVVWAFKKRGFPTDEGYAPGVSDLGSTLLGVLQFPAKDQVTVLNHPNDVAAQQPKQLDDDDEQPHQPQVHIYDVLNPKYSSTMTDRLMYVDGILQARQRGQAALAEALVHPAMLAHAHPKRVAIVGGSEGASLREVLKHASVQHVEWMEMEEAVVEEISSQWLWSQCDDLMLPTTTAACRDDPRVHKHYHEDGNAWFQKRFRRNLAAQEERQDVIIVQAMNPEDDIDFSEILLDDLGFVRLLHDGLSDDGILVVSLGNGHSLQDAPEYLTKSHDVVTLVDKLEQAGFAAIHEYEDSHSGILESATSSFLVAFKSVASDEEWFASEAQVQMKLQERVVRTKSGRVPLSYFDGATMQSYQVPSRASEVLFCKNREARQSSSTAEMNCNVQTTPVGGVDHLQLSESSKALLQERLGELDLGHGRNPASQKDVYNPFRDRNSLSHQCMAQRNEKAHEASSKPDTQQPEATKERVLNVPSAPTDTEGLHDDDGVSNGTHRPNLTTSSSEDHMQESIESEANQCLSTPPQNVQDITSAYEH